MRTTASAPLRRTLLPLAAAAALLGTMLLPTGAASAADDSSEDLVLTPRSVVTSLADLAPQQLVLAIPDGLEPVSFAADISSTTSGAGRVVISQGSRRFAVVDLADEDRLEIPIEGAEVVDGELALDIRYVLGADPDEPVADVCTVQTDEAATISAIAVRVTGTPVAPESIATFFSPGIDGIHVVVPDDAVEDTVEAGLAIVAAATAAVPLADAVTVEPAASFTEPTSPLARVVELVEGDGAASTAIEVVDDVPHLTITGSPAALRTAARGLGSTLLSLADAAETTGLTETGLPVTSLEHQLSDFAGDRLEVSGYGQDRSLITVRQDAFGGPLSEIQLRLVGTATTLPESIVGTVGVYWNDELVDSFVLGSASQIDREIVIRSGQLQGANTLGVQLNAAPRNGGCTTQSTVIPVEFHVDTHTTTLTGVRGQSLAPGFARFPQVLSGSLPIAFGSDGVDAVTLASAADLVAALQRVSGPLLEVDVLGLDEFATDARSGLVIGADLDDSNRFESPMRMDEFRTTTATALDFGVGIDASYAALQVFEQAGRTVAMLGSWTPDGGAASQLQGRLTASIVDLPFGWSSLYEDLAVASGTAEDDPVILSTGAIIPQTVVVNEYRFEVWWVVAVIGILVLIGLIGWLLRRRRARRVRLIVDAQRSADAGAGGAL